MNINGDIKVDGTPLKNMFLYSTTDQVIGKWIDGKPIYRKIVSLDGIEIDEFKHIVVNVSSLNIDTYINANGFITLTSQWGTKLEPIQRIEPSNVSGFGIGYGDITTDYFVLFCGSGYTSSNGGWLMLEYTKTN